jgi:hypothetical protein
MIDPLVSLAHAVYSSKGVYAVLLGSGLSRAAGIPTGWEITLELIRRVAVAEGVKEIDDLAEWYRETKGREPDYSALLDVLAATPEERRAVLHGFIAPKPQDVEAGIKVPTAAHRALARLAAAGYIRVILTTNFDRLTETALREAGVEPMVISSADDAAGAVPLPHAGCVVVKLHGDYLDTRIRNTPVELASYDPRLDQYLDRVLDEFGLVVIGWSGEWDEALRAAIARCPTRRFTTWWAARGGRLEDRARDLVAGRRAQVIAIEDADHFLSSLEQKVLSLEEMDRAHPLSAKLAVAELKRYLLDPQQRIRLHDLVFGEVHAAVARLDGITSIGEWTEQEFRRRVEAYEAASEILRPLATTGARWCREEDEPMWCEVVRRTCQSYRFTAGDLRWIELQAYLPLLTFYAVGLGATAGGRFGLLKQLFEMRVRLPEELSVVESLLPFRAFSELRDQVWDVLTAPRGSATPVSNRLVEIFGRELPDLTGDRADFEALFDRFEIMATLSCAHQRAPADFDPAQLRFHPGRFASRLSRIGFGANQTWFDQADAERNGWPPLAAGLFGGSFERFSQLRAALVNFIRRIGW